MLVLLLAYLGGILTILSPCILPVLPFVFARADRPFLTNGLPLLAGMALTFALVATLAAFGGAAALAANQWGRILALVLLSAFALLLIFPSLSTRAMQPLVRLGERLGNRADQGGVGSSLLLGVATGLLWAPCAGPILGLILTTAALSGASANTALLLLAYALGAATSLALALLVGGKVFATMKRSIGAGERVRQLLGILILIGVAAIALGLDTKVLARLSSSQTNMLEQGLAERLGLGSTMPRSSSALLEDEGPMPSIAGATGWINSAPLTNADLKGKVVLVDFWTYSCINCVRTIPYVRAWHERYKDDGFVVLGVHTPEFAFERDPANVAKAVRDFRITYPVAIDNKWTIWGAFQNRYWPAHYLIDANGRIRYRHFGEGRQDETEAAIRRLLAEAGRRPEGGTAAVVAEGAEAASSKQVFTRETYLGTHRSANVATVGGLREGQAITYPAPPALTLGQWAYQGDWRVEKQRGVALAPGGKLSIRFKARDLHLVLGSGDGKPLGFTVTLDGKAPGADAGVDIDATGRGTINGQRLYQLVRHRGGARERVFTITFDRAGAEAYAFTFG